MSKKITVMAVFGTRLEAIAAGTVKLVGTELERVYQETRKLLIDKNEYNYMAGAVNPYGDGKAAERIVEAIMYKYGLIDRQPNAFVQ